jgi:hypothetical protein
MRRVLALAAAAGISAACSAGSLGEAIRPGDPRAGDALGESCKKVGTEAEPLVVDLPPHERADLEEAVNGGGLAVVAYDCKSMRLLKSCSAAGSYAFQGLSPRRQTIVLENADEIRTNLPSLGPALAVKLEGELARGSTLDLDMLMVGKRRTTVTGLEASDLRGDCAGATHFVRGTYVGAFELSTRTSGSARLAVEVFGAGSDASSDSKKRVSSSDGELGACNTASPALTAAPERCDALLRLELVGVGSAHEGSREAKRASLSTAAAWRACAEGLVLTDGKCASPTPGRPFQCRSEQPIECAEQCGQGHGGSCATLGILYERGLGVAKDTTRSTTYFDKGCQQGDAYACTNLGVMLERGEGIAADPARAAKLYGESCDRGDENGCYNLALAREVGRGISKDATAARELYRRACDGGDGPGCNNLGYMLEHGQGGAADEPRAAEQYRRACEGGAADGCHNLALLHELGKGVRKDAIRAVSLYGEACEKKHPASCAAAATFFEEGAVVPRDVAKARALYQQACEAGAGQGCHGLGSLLERGEGVAASPSEAAKLYEKGCMLGDLDACSDFGVLLQEGRGVTEDDARARGVFEGACASGHGTACVNLGAMLELGRGGPKNELRAAELYEKACTGGTASACGNLAELVETGASGKKRDKDAAIALYKKACEGGHDTACRALSRLGAK